MTYKVRESFGLPIGYGAPRFAETLEEAKALLGEIILIEEDAENPGFFDAFTKTGSLYVIEEIA
jgi:hypothetical protein